jgi:hypothetical protein
VGGLVVEMKTKDQIDLKKGICPPHRWPHFGKLHTKEKCHVHKSKLHQLHHIICCKLIRCKNYKYMFEKQKNLK